jgi:plasmid stabilization system protein ParE
MAHRVIWSSRALLDIESLAAYISIDSPAYARIVVKKIITATRKLSQFPNLGREVPEFQETKIRELFEYSYRIIYEVESEQVTIVAVIHGKRQLS